jgi:hypothetical protein
MNGERLGHHHTFLPKNRLHYCNKRNSQRPEVGWPTFGLRISGKLRVKSSKSITYLLSATTNLTLVLEARSSHLYKLGCYTASICNGTIRALTDDTHLPSAACVAVYCSHNASDLTLSSSSSPRGRTSLRMTAVYGLLYSASASQTLSAHLCISCSERHVCCVFSPSSAASVSRTHYWPVIGSQVC